MKESKSKNENNRQSGHVIYATCGHGEAPSKASTVAARHRDRLEHLAVFPWLIFFPFDGQVLVVVVCDRCDNKRTDAPME